MDALILAGGLGTRLATALPHLPKTLAPIQKVPFLQILLNQLQKWEQITRVILAVGHKASFIEDYVQTIQYPLPILLSKELSPLGTGGAVLNALPLIEGPTFLAMNGDSFFDIEFTPFLNFHRSKRGEISIASLDVEDTSRFGSLSVNSSSRVMSFVEKSPEKRNGIINGGIYLFEKRVLMPFQSAPCSLENDIFPTLLFREIYAYTVQRTFIDIGTPASLLQAQTLIR